MPWGSLAASIGGSLISGMMNDNAAEDAASQSRMASEAATALQRQMYEEGVTRNQPWYNAGKDAVGKLSSLLYKPFNFQADPGYQFRRNEGMRGIEQRAAAGGGLRSGNTLKALLDYNQNLASGEYGNAYNRWNNDLNRIAALAGTGQTAGAQNNAMGQAYGNAAGGYGMQAGGDAGTAALLAGQGWGNAVRGIGQVFGQRSMNQPGGFWGGGDAWNGSGANNMGSDWGWSGPWA